MHHYYIYYDVPAPFAGPVRNAVEELQRALAAQTGIRGRLLRRRDRAETWMEIYEGVADPASFEEALEREVARLDLPALLGSGSRRHTEVFVPLV